MFCICSNVKASIFLTERWICNDLKSNGSAHFQGYCSFEMGLFEDSGSNFILLNSEITGAFLKYSVSSQMASQCTMSFCVQNLNALLQYNSFCYNQCSIFVFAFPMDCFFLFASELSLDDGVAATEVSKAGSRAEISLAAQMVKNLPAVQETEVQSLGWDDPLEKGMTTHSSILAWRIMDRGTVHGVVKSWWETTHTCMTRSGFEGKTCVWMLILSPRSFVALVHLSSFSSGIFPICWKTTSMLRA